MDVFAAEESAHDKLLEARLAVEKCRLKLAQRTKKRSESMTRASGLERLFLHVLKKMGSKWSALNDEIEALNAHLKRLDLAYELANEEWTVLKSRADAVRLVDLWKWRAFSRLYRSRSEQAEQMREWIDREIRPYITSIVIAADGWVHYRLTFFTQSVSIHRKLRQVIDPCRVVERPPKFRMRNPMWKDNLPNGPWNSLALALFILAPRLTSSGRDFGYARSWSSTRGWISTRERDVLLSQPEPRHLNLLEHWIPCMPGVLCKLIGSYHF
jgi:hypothetical protein